MSGNIVYCVLSPPYSLFPCDVTIRKFWISDREIWSVVWYEWKKKQMEIQSHVLRSAYDALQTKNISKWNSYENAILWLQWNEHFVLFFVSLLFAGFFPSHFSFIFLILFAFSIHPEKLINKRDTFNMRTVYVELCRCQMPTAERKRIIMNFESYAIIHFASVHIAHRCIDIYGTHIVA